MSKRNANPDTATKLSDAELRAQDDPNTPPPAAAPDPEALQQGALDAFEQGLQASAGAPDDATVAPSPRRAAKTPQEPKAGPPNPDDGEDDVDEDLDENGNPKVRPDDDVDEDDLDDEDGQEIADDEAAAAAQAKVDDEVKALGLKGKAEQRFRSLCNDIGERDRKITQLETYREHTKAAVDIQEALLNTRTTPDQFGAMLFYFDAVNRRDPDALAQAWEMLEKEQEFIGTLIGKKAGGHDPLAAHADLRKEVDDGVISEERALELASLRARGKLMLEHQQEDRAARQQDEEREKGLNDLALLGAELKAADAAVYAARLPMLRPLINEIVRLAPPKEWEERVRRAFVSLPRGAAPAAGTLPGSKPARAPVRQQPMRPSGAGATVPVARKATSAEDAFSMGLDAARERGLGG
jgi:hypothetical protein